MKMPAARTLTWLTGGMLLLVTLAVYWPAGRFDFINLDDPDYVSANPQVQAGLTVPGVAWAFTTFHAGNWHPLTWLSHQLDTTLFGPGPRGPHLVNVGLHALNTLLVFGLLHVLTGARWRSAVVAALFALHPLHVESVAWISERKDVLSACFGLLTLLAYARYVAKSKVSAETSTANLPDQIPSAKSQTTEIQAAKAPSAATENPQPAHFNLLRAGGWYWLALGLFALGLMSKPMLVTWPAVMLLLDVWPLRRVASFEFRVPGFKELWSFLLPHSSLLREKLPFLALVVASAVITMVAQQRGGAVHSLVDTSLGSRLANAVVAYGRYVGKTFWPVDLATPYPLTGTWPLSVVLTAAGLLLAVTAVGWWVRKSSPGVLIGWLWFGGTLVPVIGLVQVGSQSMADRYFYLPSIGLFLAGAWGLTTLAGRWRWGQHALAGAGLLALLALGLRTTDQLRYWQNSETLFSHAVQVTRGNYIAHYNLGHHYDRAGQRAAAEEHYRAAAQARPNYPDPWNNLGALLAGQGRWGEALGSFRAAHQARPDDGSIRTNLYRGLILGAKQAATAGEWETAAGWLREAIELLPQSYEAHSILGTVCARQGQLQQAVDHWRAALVLNPNNANVHANLSQALATLGQADAAEAHRAEAMRLRKDGR